MITVPAFAKINLDLRVLNKRPDGYHELRTIFQTISLADRIGISYARARRSQVTITGPDIPDNLIARAADALLAEWKLTARVDFRLDKRIPMGAGLGGGSSDAAAVLLALPVLARKPLPVERAFEIAAELGSDVPFFLLGGTAAGVGRGTELYPLENFAGKLGLLLAPGIHVSTASAYRDLDAMQGLTMALLTLDPARWTNDFESSVFARHPRLADLRDRLQRSGASPARMSGSGSSIFGLFDSKAAVDRARKSFPDCDSFPFTLVSRARYRSAWWRALQPAGTQHTWPPRHSPLARESNAQ